MARIDAFLKLGMQQGCSDVHLAVGVPPMLRMNGDLMPIKFRDVGDAEPSQPLLGLGVCRWDEADDGYAGHRQPGERFAVELPQVRRQDDGAREAGRGGGEQVRQVDAPAYDVDLVRAGQCRE